MAYWAERTPAKRRRTYPTFRGEETAEVVVIGGGLTGCVAAAVFAQAGLDVVLVEAGRLAQGSTAGSLGVIVPEPGADFRTVAARSGRRTARAAWTLAQRSAKEFATFLGREKIACDLKPVSCWINATSPEEVAAVRRDQAAKRDAGLVARWGTAAAATAELGTSSLGAHVAGAAFTFDPVRAALGLAARARGRGARIFEQSKVKRTRFTRKGARVVLEHGTIATSFVFVATAEPGALFSQLRRHVQRRHAYAVVTEPWTAAMRREAGRRASVVTEAGSDPHWLRWLPGDRALFAGASGPAVPERQRDKTVRQRAGQLMYELSVRYPAISGLPASHAWDVPLTSTLDGLPWLGPHRNYPFHYFALAFGWHGEGLAWLAARAAVRTFRGEPTREDAAFGFLR